MSAMLLLFYAQFCSCKNTAFTLMPDEPGSQALKPGFVCKNSVSGPQARAAV
jgi:hypothetical protein